MLSPRDLEPYRPWQGLRLNLSIHPFRISDSAGENFAFFHTFEQADETRKYRCRPTVEVWQHRQWAPVDYDAVDHREAAARLQLAGVIAHG